ncbi:hypothetical protein E2C01_036654 [Portunus trituberculatus]|uniref:RNase H type-1 domain-containing protein n=1 Tax=Portunus trituberculatus TaxID=210409 RepID=A0A5B7FCN6_PORTR|nr:hypothetical protein [Portunus trituberculatus]
MEFSCCDMCRYHLTRWDCGGATHSRRGGGGVLDKVVSVRSGRRPRVGSNPTTYHLETSDGAQLVLFTPKSKVEVAVLQKQRALKTIAAVASSIPAPHSIFTDGSVQPDGRAGSVVFHPDMDLPVGVMRFVWIPSHVDRSHNDAVDNLAKAACGLAPSVNQPLPSLHCYWQRLMSVAMLAVEEAKDTQWMGSESIEHYVSCGHSFKYCHTGLMVRRHNVASARIRLDY